ncbi:MAG: MFS transporter [Pseudomonadota bacterium]
MSTAAATQQQVVSAWAPFSQRAFLLLWSATLISNTGTWMNDVGAGWLMTTLNPSPAVVSLVQAATTLPIFLFALLAGTLADRLDKRRLLVTINIILCVVAVLMAWLVSQQAMTPVLLIAFTFLLGTGAAFIAPAWQAVVPELVPRQQLAPAIALNSMGINVSRAIGPALAGLLITVVGLSSPFFVNAVSYLVIILVLLAWKPAAKKATRLPPEPLIPAMITGLRHVRHNGPFKGALLRALSYFLFASAFWALLPLIARQLPGDGAGLYGLLLAAVGSGAVAGALLLPKLRPHLNAQHTVALGVVLTAAAMMLLGVTTHPNAALVASVLAGLGWITVLTSLNVSAQTALPSWVRARGLSVFLMVFFGSMAVGSVIWGQVAQQFSVSAALIAAAITALIALACSHRVALTPAEELDLAPSSHWPQPLVQGAEEDQYDRGPVMISITYHVLEQHTAAFLTAVQQLSGERYRDGAFQWGIFQQSENPRLWVESFQVSSWAEHLRQHDRVTQSDRKLQEQVRLYHHGDKPPVVEHWLAPGPDALVQPTIERPK